MCALRDRRGCVEKDPFNEYISTMWGMPLVVLSSKNLLAWGLYRDSTMRVEGHTAAGGHDFNRDWILIQHKTKCPRGIWLCFLTATSCSYGLVTVIPTDILIQLSVPKTN